MNGGLAVASPFIRPSTKPYFKTDKLSFRMYVTKTNQILPPENSISEVISVSEDVYARLSGSQNIVGYTIDRRNDVNNKDDATGDLRSFERQMKN